jgi:hypothetical protein
MAQKKFPLIEAEVTLLTFKEGGRSIPLNLQGPYRPHLVVGDPKQRKAILGADGKSAEDYLGVQFHPIDRVLEPGSSATLNMDLMYHPSVDYAALLPGVTFTIREGGKVVGFGKVLRRTSAI